MVRNTLAESKSRDKKLHNISLENFYAGDPFNFLYLLLDIVPYRNPEEKKNPMEDPIANNFRFIMRESVTCAECNAADVSVRSISDKGDKPTIKKNYKSRQKDVLIESISIQSSHFESESGALTMRQCFRAYFNQGQEAKCEEGFAYFCDNPNCKVNKGASDGFKGQTQCNLKRTIVTSPKYMLATVKRYSFKSEPIDFLTDLEINLDEFMLEEPKDNPSDYKLKAALLIS
jgi:uncharacterized UBP type Zn finger protein